MTDQKSCLQDDGTYDHDWKVERDDVGSEWPGDPGFFWTKSCRVCGAEGEVTDDDMMGDDDDY